jgi:outer membrane protein assembly factor BamE (lipoprotein component of BamABCDE complex)
MKRLTTTTAACALALLAGCATTPASPPGTVLAEARLAQQPVQPGVTTKAQLLALLGPTTSIRFDNGVEVWRYLLPAPPGQPEAFGEYVVLLGADGIVSKTRRADRVYQIPGKK